jgi:hypothetical protein
MTKPRVPPIKPATASLADVLGGGPTSPTAALPTRGPLSPEYRDLARAVAAKKQAGFREMCVWVFNNAGTEPSEIDKSDIPSRGAIRALQWVQSSPANYPTFFALYARAVSDKGVAEAQAAAELGARRLTGQLDRIMERFNGVQSAQQDFPPVQYPALSATVAATTAAVSPDVAAVPRP